MQTDTVYRQELALINTLFLCMWDTDTMFKQAIGIYMHACRLTADNYKFRELTILLQATPSLRRVWIPSVLTLWVLFTIYISMYNSKSLLQRDVFRVSYLCRFYSISNFGEL